MWLGHGADIDSLLPGVLPFNLTFHVAQSDHRLNCIYGSYTYADKDHPMAAKCCLRLVSPSSLFN